MAIYNKPKEVQLYYIKSGDYSIIKSFIKFIKLYGFVRERNKYVSDRYILDINVMFSWLSFSVIKRDNNTMNTVTLKGGDMINFDLDIKRIIEYYDLKLYNGDNSSEYLIYILDKLKIVIKKEMNHITRKNKTGKLLSL